MLNVLPLNMMAIAMGLHVRCGIEDNLWTQDRKAKMSRSGRSSSWSESRVSLVATSLRPRRPARFTGSASSMRTPTRPWRATASRRIAIRPARPLRRIARVAVTCLTVLIVPGLRDHVDDHWQTLLAARLHACERCRRWGESRPRRARGAIEQTARRSTAHHRRRTRGGVIMVVHWAQWTRRRARRALAAPPDFERPMPPGFPTTYALQAGGWLPVPKDLLPFQAS